MKPMQMQKYVYIEIQSIKNASLQAQWWNAHDLAQFAVTEAGQFADPELTMSSCVYQKYSTVSQYNSRSLAETG